MTGLQSKEVMLISPEGDVLGDGEMISQSGTAVTFKDEREVQIGPGCILVSPCGVNELKLGSEVLLVAMFGCGGQFLHRGEFGGLESDSVVLLKKLGRASFRKIDIGQFLGGAHEVLYSSHEVKIVTESGETRTDGFMTRKVGSVVEFHGGRTCNLAPTDLVVESCHLSAFEQDDRILLVDRWGCGGAHMATGYFGKRLSPNSICFKRNAGEDYSPRQLGALAGGTYRILS